MTYRGRLYIFAIIKPNHLKIYMFGVVEEIELIWFDYSKDIQPPPISHYAHVTSRCLICTSNKLKYLENEARKRKTAKDVILTF